MFNCALLFNLISYGADSLFGFYIRKEQWEKAEEYLSYFSKENPERKRKQTFIYSKTGRLEEAYRTYEQILYHAAAWRHDSIDAKIVLK